MQKILCKVEYEGAAYHGWQIQTDNLPTVQGEIERVLSTILGRPTEIFCCGRTDAGVHALGQVFTFELDNPIPLRRLLRSLNALLPKDIAILAIKEVPHSFSVRRDNCGKRYLYQAYNASMRSVFDRRDHWLFDYQLDQVLITQASKELIGTHDFAAFRGRHCQSKGTIKTIYRINVDVTPFREGQKILFQVEGSGFLHHMVRIIVGTLVDLGRGKLPPDAIQRALSSGKRKDLGLTAPPQGLFLDHVFFVPDPFS